MHTIEKDIQKLAKEYFKSPLKNDNRLDLIAQIIKDNKYDEKLLYGSFNIEEREMIMKRAYRIQEVTASADLGTAPDTAIFKKPKKKKQIRTFKEIAMAQETDTFIKEEK